MTKFFTGIALLLSSMVTAQNIFGPQQVLINDLTSVYVVAHGDVTGNGYQDLLAAGFFETRLVLFENGPNGFSNTTVLYEGDSPRAVLAIDIDNDDDLDVVFSSNNTKDVKYIINNGDSNFSNPTTITTLLLLITDLKSVDIDDDGDDDILLASAGVSSRWFENVNGSFPTEHIITGPAGSSLEVGDLDGDGDLDIVSSASGSTTCVWYRNNGNGTFSNPITIRGSGNASSSVFVSDLNGDTLLDVLVTINGDDSLLWYENLGEGLFGPEQTINTNLISATRVIAADLDMDNDMDVVANAFDQVVWFENLDGEGTFGDKISIDNTVSGSFSTIAVDLDNDGDLDLANASRNDNTVAWYENTTILGVDGPKAVAFSVTPNPSSDFFIINATQAGVAEYTLYNLQGKKLASYPANTHTLDASSLKTGVYILALTTTRGDVLYQKIVRK